MTHRTSKYARTVRPLSSSHAQAAVKVDGRWIVRTMAGASATKHYRCPGCQAPIPAGTAHLVVWPDTPRFGNGPAVDDRRHWHRSCWERRP